MDKDSYIRRWPLEATCQGGRLPLRGGVIDESSGSSGTATNWVRGPRERYATRRLIQFSARATFGDVPFILLNAFALGPWATGMNVSMSLVDRCVVKSIGPDAKRMRVPNILHKRHASGEKDCHGQNFWHNFYSVILNERHLLTFCQVGCIL